MFYCYWETFRIWIWQVSFFLKIRLLVCYLVFEIISWEKHFNWISIYWAFLNCPRFWKSDLNTREVFGPFTFLRNLLGRKKNQKFYLDNSCRTMQKHHKIKWNLVSECVLVYIIWFIRKVEMCSKGPWTVRGWVSQMERCGILESKMVREKPGEWEEETKKQRQRGGRDQKLFPFCG